jgi:hypothetical protein
MGRGHCSESGGPISSFSWEENGESQGTGRGNSKSHFIHLAGMKFSSQNSTPALLKKPVVAFGVESGIIP